MNDAHKKNIERLLIATHNFGKLREFQRLLFPYDVEILSLQSFPYEMPEETGTTFAENSLIKARAIASKSKKVTLADDSGLEILAIDSQPGIYSARWAENDDYNVAFKRIREELKRNGTSDRSACFRCSLALVFPDDKHQQEYLFEGSCSGHIEFPPRGMKGFGYDPIFVPNNYDKTFAELSSNEKNKISHRNDALNKFISFVEDNELFTMK